MTPLRIFISYGRDQFASLAARLAVNLAARLECDVWFDQELHTSQTWGRLIQQKLRWLAELPADGRFIYLLTQHSTRDDSFCLREMQYALDHAVQIFPLLIETCEIPIEIYDRQRLDFRAALPVGEHEAELQELLARLVRDLGVEPQKSPDRPASPVTEPVSAPTLRVPAAGATRTREKDGMVEVYIPAGEFQMGSNHGNDDEKPPHLISLDGYWIDQIPVTNAMFAAFLNEFGNQPEEDADWYDPDGGKIRLDDKVWRSNRPFENHPVVNVTWYGARAYARWTGARLPTEAEWEKAARGTDRRRYPWGNDDPDATLANYGKTIGTTTAAGNYPAGASPYGVLDLAGNVWEWCSDVYWDKFYQVSPARNPHWTAKGESRVVRGGCWYIEAWYLRASFRGKFTPKSRYVGQGFRCARS